MLSFSSSLLLPSALAALLMGLVMSVRGLFAGYAIVSGVGIAFALFQAFQLGWLLSPGRWILLGMMVFLAALGLGIEAISDRFRLRRGWVSQNTVWGGLIGGMLGLFLFGGAFWMLLGTLAGTVAVQFSGRRGMRFGQAFIEGLEGFMAMFGSAGLRVLLAVVVIDLFLDFAASSVRSGF